LGGHVLDRKVGMSWRVADSSQDALAAADWAAVETAV